MHNTHSEKVEWQMATLLKTEMIAENVRAMSFRLERWLPHVAGQFYEVGLTLADGYCTQRSYSAASAPEDIGYLELGVELIRGGEVSPYLFSLEPGDQVEMRGPIGRHFSWTADPHIPGPLILIGGGSGMVPLMCMLRHWLRHRTEGANINRPIIIIVSCRTQERILYRRELQEIVLNNPNVQLVITLTGSIPEGWRGKTGRVDTKMLRTLLEPHQEMLAKSSVYICGPTSFVEAMEQHAMETGIKSVQVRTERFT